MSEQISSQVINFDFNYNNLDDKEAAKRIAIDALALGNIAIQFAGVERIPKYNPETRENNAEHSYMLALIAQEIAQRFFPELDPGLVSQFSIVHDLLELITGDVATFSITDARLQEKADSEHNALEKLCEQLPPYTAHLLALYEKQDCPEARFVRHIDKKLPKIVDIIGPGSSVMHQDYQTFTLAQLNDSEDALKNRYARMFPEPEHDVLHKARVILAEIFSEVFVPVPYIQDPLF